MHLTKKFSLRKLTGIALQILQAMAIFYVLFSIILFAMIELNGPAYYGYQTIEHMFDANEKLALTIIPGIVVCGLIVVAAVVVIVVYIAFVIVDHIILNIYREAVNIISFLRKK